MKLPETIKTDRLLLPKPVLEDAQPIYDRYASNPTVVRFLTWLPHANLAETRQFLEDQIADWEVGGSHAFTITQIEDESVIGMFGFRISGHLANAGYVLAPDYWGKGYMSEALSAMRHVVFEHPDIHRFWLVCDVDNMASARVMEKAGFEKEGTLRKMMIHPNISRVPRDCLCYAAVKN